MGGAGYNQSKGGIPTGGGYQPPAAASYGGQQSQFSAPVTGGMKSASKPAGPTETPTFGSVQSQIKPVQQQAQGASAMKPAAQNTGAGDAFANFKPPVMAQPQATPQTTMKGGGRAVVENPPPSGPEYDWYQDRGPELPAPDPPEGTKPLYQDPNQPAPGPTRVRHPSGQAPIPSREPVSTEQTPIPYRGGYGQQLNDAITEASGGRTTFYSPNVPTASGSWGMPGAIPGK